MKPCPTIYPERRTWTAETPQDQPIVTHDVPCGGTLRPCPICGAVRYCGREGRCLDDHATTAHWVRRRFTIDDLYEPPLEGWTRGERWNGWACPRFELAEAQRLMALTTTGQSAMSYDPVADAFTIVLVTMP